MPKYNSYQIDDPGKKEKKQEHPIWRGIGCILIIIIPLFSYFASSLLVDRRQYSPWLIIPQEIVVTNFKDPLIFVKVVYAVIIALILFLLMAVVTFAINQFSGPRRIGPFKVNRKLKR
jgi:hypothetical protein